MRLYWELMALGVRRQITYRTATLAGMATNFFWGLLRAAVIIALYGSQREVAGISLPAAITYTGITQAIIAYLSLFSWYELMTSVRSGQVGSDLLKPMSFVGFWMAQDFGRGLVNLVGRGLPIMIFFALVFGVTTPHGPAQWLGTAAALWLSWLVSFGWRFLINLSAFWVPDARGIGRMLFTLALFLSGFMMPLRFLPAWFQQLCYLTPFPQAVNTFVEAYLGVLTGPALLRALLWQLIWGLGLLAAGQIVLRLGVRRLVIQGG